MGGGGVAFHRRVLRAPGKAEDSAAAAAGGSISGNSLPSAGGGTNSRSGSAEVGRLCVSLQTEFLAKARVASQVLMKGNI